MNLKANLECGAGDQGRYYIFKGPFNLERDLGGGVKIRLYNNVHFWLKLEAFDFLDLTESERVDFIRFSISGILGGGEG